MPHIDDYWDELEDINNFRSLERRPFYLEGVRPVDRLAPVGQQLVDVWHAEHGDEPFPE